MNMAQLISFGVAAAAAQQGGGRILHGLALAHNSPAQFSLARVNTSTGKATTVGPAHKELFGMSDLVTTAHGQLYYLGDTGAGATLVALNLTTGAKICSAHVDVDEISYVGVGQSLDLDSKSDTLVLSGIHKDNASHVLYRAPAKGCGPFTRVGKFGLADYVPMLHASTLDADGQRLFVTLATGESSAAIGIIDLTAGTMHAVAENIASDMRDSLLCLHWDKLSKPPRVIGVIASQATGLLLHALDPSGNGTWLAPRALKKVPATWDELGGNGATMSAFDAAKRTLYFLAGHADEKTGANVLDLAQVDVDSAVVQAAPPLSSVGIAGCDDCLTAITL